MQGRPSYDNDDARRRALAAMASRGERPGAPSFQPRTAALAGSRRHLGPLHQPEERRRPIAGADSPAPSSSVRSRRSPERPARPHAGAPGPARRRGGKGAMYVRRGISINPRRGRMPARPLAMLAPLALVAVVALAWLAWRGAPTEPAPSLAARTGSALSDDLQRVAMVIEAPRVPPTPRDEWKKGIIPHLYQTDPAWASESYAGEDIATSGCGPTSLAMVYIGLTGDTDMDPVAMAKFSESNGHVQEGMTAWTLFTEGASRLGISGTALPSWEQTVREELASGTPLVFNVKPGSAFTTTGHYIVATGLDEEDRVIVNDPNSYALSAMTWDLGYLIEHSSNIWAFELA